MEEIGETPQGFTVYRDYRYSQTRQVIKAECDRDKCQNTVVRRKDKYLKKESNYCSHSCAIEDRNQEKENNGNYKGKKKYYKKVKESSKCIVCGEKNPNLLEFHHSNPENKIKAVSRMAITKQYSLQDLKEEIGKCDLICSNCHVVKHRTKCNEQENKDIENQQINFDNIIKTEDQYQGKIIYKKEMSDGNLHRHIIRSCDFCGQRYLARLDLIKNGKGKYHNLSCSTYDKWDSGTFGESKIQKKKELVERIKEEGQCQIHGCNEDRKECLEFHHKNPELKEDTISNMIEGNYSVNELEEEIDKCCLYCRNCHMLHHMNE